MILAQHPLSAAFPAMSSDDFQSLKDSIENIGVQNPITLYEGMVIDGWHRYTAANDLGMPCPTVELADVDPREFVLAQNKSRRHITQAQLIAAASAVYQWRPNGGNHSALSAECISSKDLAAKLGTGVRSVEQFRHVERKAAPEVVAAVNRGEIGLPKAAAIAKLPKEDQAAAIDKPLAAIKPPKQQEAAPIAEEPPEDDVNSVELMEELHKENEALQKQIAILLEENTKAELHKMMLQRDHAVRQQNEAQDRAHESQKLAKRLGQQVRDCCQILGIDDPRFLVGTLRKRLEEQEA